LLLAFVLKRKIGAYLDRAFYKSILKITLSTIMMLAAIGLMEYFMPWDTSAGLQTRLLYLISAVVVGAAMFFISAYLLQSPEIHSLMGNIKRRLNR